MAIDDTPYALCCDQIETDLGTLSPPDNTAVVYQRMEGEVEDYGASSDRGFFFEINSGDLTSAQSVTVFNLDEYFDLVIVLKRAHRNVKTYDQALRAEAIAIMNQINERQNWPVGVRFCTAIGYKFESSARFEDSIELRINCHIHTANAN